MSPLDRRRTAALASILALGLLASDGRGDDPRLDVRLLLGERLDGETTLEPAIGVGTLSAPFGVDFTPEGHMVVVELEGGRVHAFDQEDSQLRLVAGDGSIGAAGDGGPAHLATFNGMHNVAVAGDGTIYISDTWNHSVRAIDPEAGTIRTIAGGGEPGFAGDGGPAEDARFHDVICVALDPADRHLYLADIANRRVRAIDLESGVVRTVAGNGERGAPTDGAIAVESPLVDPRAVAADAEGRVYILERGGHALRVVEPDGTIRTVVGDGTAGYADGPGRAARLNSPKHLCLDDLGRVFIADDENAAIRLYDPESGQVTTLLGRGEGHPEVELSHPHGVCVRGTTLYVVDTRHDRIFQVEGAIAPAKR